MARASVEAVQEGRSQQAERINACFLTAGRDSVSCFQGRRPFLKFCFPQINAAGSARGLRVPGDCEGAGESLPRPLRQAPSPVAAPPPPKGPPALACTPPAEQLTATPGNPSLGPVWASFLHLRTGGGGHLSAHQWGNKDVVLHSPCMWAFNPKHGPG